MFRHRIIIAIYLNLLLFLSVFGLACNPSGTPTPTPVLETPTPLPTLPSTLEPDKMGVNFWDPIPNPAVSVADLFSSQGGYVLLQTIEGTYQNRYDNLASSLSSTLSAGLKPIIRYDHQPETAVPKCVQQQQKLCTYDKIRSTQYAVRYIS